MDDGRARKPCTPFRDQHQLKEFKRSTLSGGATTMIFIADVANVVGSFVVRGNNMGTCGSSKKYRVLPLWWNKSWNSRENKEPMQSFHRHALQIHWVMVVPLDHPTMACSSSSLKANWVERLLKQRKYSASTSRESLKKQPTRL